MGRFYPPDSPYWLRDENRKPVIGWGEDTNYDGKIDEQDEVLNFLIDFTNPEIHHLIAQKSLPLTNSKLFDGIMLDWWSEDFATSPIASGDWSNTKIMRKYDSMFFSNSQLKKGDLTIDLM